MRIRPDTTLWYHFDHSLVGEKTDIDCIREQWSERETGRRKTRQKRRTAGQHPETNQHRPGQAGTGMQRRNPRPSPDQTARQHRHASTWALAGNTEPAIQAILEKTRGSCSPDRRGYGLRHLGASW